MDKSDIEIGLLKESEIELVIEFYNSIYKSNRNRESFVWEFQKSPALQAIYVIAKEKSTGKIIGTQCAIPIEIINNRKEIVLTAKSEDTLVHPNFRGLNIFENMYQLLFSECKEKGIEYIWGFTNARKPFIKLGFDIPFHTQQSLLVFNILSSIKYLLEYNPKKTLWTRIKTITLCLFSKFYSIKYILSTTSFNVREHQCVVLDKKNIPDNSLLIQDVISSSTDLFIIKQNTEYLKWRLTDNPYHNKIACISFLNGPKTISNIIFNHHKNGVWYLIQDLYSSSLNEKEKRSILKKAINELKTQEKGNLKLIRTWRFDHNLICKNNLSISNELGFTNLNKGPLFVWKSLNAKKSLNPSNFILSRLASQGMI